MASARPRLPNRLSQPTTPEGREQRLAYDALRRDIQRQDKSVADEAASDLADEVEDLEQQIADAIDLIPPPSAVTPTTAPAPYVTVGVAVAYARGDHDHELLDHASEHLPSGGDALTTAAASTITDSTNSTGTANSLSRSDHGHAHGDRGGGTLHAVVVSGGAAGFMTGSDKDKLDDMPIAQNELMMSPGFAGTAAASTKAITSGRSFAVCMGRLKANATSFVVSYRVTVAAAAAITWAEVAIATGDPVSSGNPTLTVIGYTDVATPWAGTGIFNTTVTATQSGGPYIWAVFGNQAATGATLRATSAPDDILAGWQALVVNRPSTILNTPTAFTQEGIAVLPEWCAVRPN